MAVHIFTRVGEILSIKPDNPSSAPWQSSVTDGNLLRVYAHRDSRCRIRVTNALGVLARFTVAIDGVILSFSEREQGIVLATEEHVEISHWRLFDSNCCFIMGAEPIVLGKLPGGKPREKESLPVEIVVEATPCNEVEPRRWTCECIVLS